MLDHVLGAPSAEVLLVGDREVDERAPRCEAGPSEVAERDRHRRSQVEHVDRAASPHVAVDDLARKRVALPTIRVDRHDIGMAHQQQRRRVRVAALDARDEVLAAGLRGKALELETGVAEVLREHVRAAALEARLGRSVVDARVADQVREKVARLFGERSVVGDHEASDTR